MEENERLFHYIYGEREIITEETGQDIIRYIRGYDLISSDSERARTYYHYTSDELGSITHVVNGNAPRIENVYEYDSFGNTVHAEENVHNPFRYTGQQYDSLTGLYYLRARFYNPATARFTQEDSYYGDGLNLYAYCNNNPVNYYDPEGHASTCPIEAAKKVIQKIKNRISKGGKNPQVSVAFIHKTPDGKIYQYGDVNPTAREASRRTDDIIPAPEGQRGLTFVNNSMKRAHAEVGSMNQSFMSGNRGGVGLLYVDGKDICRFCKVDVKKMALNLELEKLLVIEESSNNFYFFSKTNNNKVFYNNR